MSLLPINRRSFFGGLRNPDGSPVEMHFSRGVVYTDITPGQSFEGYENVVFGGMLFGILDVVMWYAILMATRKICMTRKTDMDFLKPVMCGNPHRAQGKLLRVEDRDVWATAWIEDGGGERCAQVTALFREARGIDHGRLMSRFDFTGVSPRIKEIFLRATP
jgi:acyl-coenzyme A thioesterase PaaI-like protein